MDNQDELVVWKLPKTLLSEIEEIFEIQKENIELAAEYKCVKKGNNFYCEKWINGSKITRGPYPSCPANCD